MGAWVCNELMQVDLSLLVNMAPRDGSVPLFSSSMKWMFGWRLFWC